MRVTRLFEKVRTLDIFWLFKLLGDYAEWKTSFIRRARNVIVHSIASFAKSIDDFVIWIEDTPDFLLSLLHYNVRFLG